MDFLTMMNNLLEVKKRFPTVIVDAEKNTWGESYLTMRVSISDENAQLLLDAQQMFEPRGDF